MRSVRNFIVSFIIVALIALSSGSVYPAFATEQPLTKVEVKAISDNAFKSQLILNTPHTKEDTMAILNFFFTPEFANSFFNTRVIFERSVYGVEYYYVPGSGNMHMYVPYFSWDDRTKISFSEDEKYITVSEYVPAGEDEMSSWDSHTMIMNFTKINGMYKISSIIYKAQ